MSVRKVNARTWPHRLIRELRRDKRKTVTLGALVLVALVMAVQLTTKNVMPLRARAAAKAVMSPIRTEAPPARSTDKGAGHADWLAQLRVGQVELTRDIFSPNPAYFPPEEKTETQVQVAPAATQPAVPQPDPKEEERAICAQARGLHLQSTMVSETPTAIINGLVLGKGDWINDFQIVEITSRVCVVAKKGVKVILEMKR